MATGFIDAGPWAQMVLEQQRSTVPMNAAGGLRFILLVAPLIAGCGGGGGAANSAPTRNDGQPPALVTKTVFVRDVANYSDYCPFWLTFAYFGCIDAARDYQRAPQQTVTGTVDGQSFDLARLDGSQDGSVMVVRSRRTTDGSGVTGVATSIDIQHVVVGTIESIDTPHARLAAVGQQIYVSDTTRIDGDGTLSVLAVGDRILVSGFFSRDGEVVATSIRHDAGGDGFLLRGILHIERPGIVSIGRLVANDVSGYAFDGDAVVVRGHSSGDFWTAESIAFIGGDLGEGQEDFQYVAGMISSRSTPLELLVEGRAVDCARFQCALTQVQVGNLVGVIHDEDGSRVQRIAVTSEAYGVTGTAEAVDTGSNALSVLGVAVQVLPTTRIVDEQGLPKRISDIRVGDTVTVMGGWVGDPLVAEDIGIYGDQPSITARAPSFADPEVHALGRTILTDETTAVFEDCVGERDQRWLFEFAAQSTVALRAQVSQGDGGEIFATRIDVDSDACYWW